MKNFIFVMLITISATAAAKVDLATLPTRDTVQLTIYNSADLTLARESRQLTLKEGTNKLQFSWANTLIDPTSLEMLPLANAGDIDVSELVFPPRVNSLGLWNVHSKVTGKIPMEISYLTSGLTWRAFYMGTLSKDEKTMRLQGYVRVTNNSGEDYENARTRLIVGKVHILDRIAELARRQYPYGRPGEPVPLTTAEMDYRMAGKAPVVEKMMRSLSSAKAKKEIRKEGLSEYFLYTIEGTETIPDGWSKRLPSFDVADVPAENLYKFEEERYGSTVMRFLSFKNDQKHKLGETPIPGGNIKVYRDLQEAGHLSYQGQSYFKYIPVDEDVELDMGPVSNVTVKPTQMDFKSSNFRYDRKGNISGWDEICVYKLEVKNTRPVPVKIEIKRNTGTQYWDIDTKLKYEKVDRDTIKYTVTLEPESEKTFKYTQTTRHGVNTHSK